MGSKEESNPWRPITLEELAKHNDVKNNDAWMAIKGIVYDVSWYANKHPGGLDSISKNAGKDATEIYNMIHAYVDASAVLEGFQIGILKGCRDVPKRGICASLKEKPWFLGSPYKPPITFFRQDSIVGIYVIEFSNPSEESEWTVGITEKTHLHIYKSNGTKKAWLSVCELPEPLENDQININFRSKYKHIHVIIRKPIPTTVWVLQTHVLKKNGRFVGTNEEQSMFDAYIIHKKCLTQNVIMFGIQVVPSARIGVPIGFHVLLHHGGVSRPYTPISATLMENSHLLHSAHARKKQQQEDKPDTVLYFMIKIYPDGEFTQILDNLEVDEGREIPTLQVSAPHGYFDANSFLHDFHVLFLVSGGTGISPMIKILQRFWRLNEKLRGKRILLWHFVQTEFDLVWRKHFLEMQKAASWFSYFPALTQASKTCNWSGLKGRISSQFINSCISDLGLEKRGHRKACICGTAGFNSAAVTALTGIVLAENMFVFSN